MFCLFFIYWAFFSLQCFENDTCNWNERNQKEINKTYHFGPSAGKKQMYVFQHFTNSIDLKCIFFYIVSLFLLLPRRWLWWFVHSIDVILLIIWCRLSLRAVKEFVHLLAVYIDIQRVRRSVGDEQCEWIADVRASNRRVLVSKRNEIKYLKWDGDIDAIIITWLRAQMNKNDSINQRTIYAHLAHTCEMKIK